MEVVHKVVTPVKIKDIIVKNRARKDFGDVEGLAQAIGEKGLLQPITIDSRKNLLAGERRLRAHILLGLTEIDAIIRPFESKIDSMEIELMENIQRKDMAWPEQAALEKKIKDYYEETHKGKQLSVRQQAEMVGSSKSAVDRRIKLAEAIELIPELAECETQDEAWKIYKKLEEGEAIKLLKEKVPEHVTEAIKEAATHYIIGDAFAGMAELDDDSFDFAEVDTPFGVDLDKRKGRNKDDNMGGYNEWDASGEFEELFRSTCNEVYRLLRPNTFAVFWYGMSWHKEVLTIIREAGFGVPDIPAIWTKGGGGQTAQPFTTFGSTYEPFFLARKGQPKMVRPGRGNEFEYKPVTNKVHPTEKPLTLLKEILDVLVDPGASILVPFLGSGVTLRAAYSCGHTGIGWDLSEDHKAGFIKRVQEDEKQRGSRNRDSDEDEA
jgi:ParB/RepB/Spo0J family partition protein